jgi:16S rRNA processing protein RimM
MQPSGSDLVLIARAVKTHGLKGEVVAELLTDFPERFEELDQVVLVAPDGQQQTRDIEKFRFQKDRVVLKLAGYDDVDAAKELVGYEFAVPEADRVQLEDDEFYDWELEGCTVKAGDESIGQVRSVLKTGGAEILVVSDANGNEKLVPLAAEIVVQIDPESKTIVIDPPEGLLDL